MRTENDGEGARGGPMTVTTIPAAVVRAVCSEQ